MHACLELIANSEQDLSTLTARRLLTYEKIAEPELDKNHLLNEEIADFRLKYALDFIFQLLLTQHFIFHADFLQVVRKQDKNERLSGLSYVKLDD